MENSDKQFGLRRVKFTLGAVARLGNTAQEAISSILRVVKRHVLSNRVSSDNCSCKKRFKLCRMVEISR